MKALILAAGKGTRLGQMTLTMPKPMLPIADQPLLAHLVQWLSSYGVTEIAVNLHHAPTVIADYFNDGSKYGVRITYSYEPVLMGTAGAAKQLEYFLDERFVIVFGDVFTNLNLGRLEEFHRSQLAQVDMPQNNRPQGLTMALYHVENPTACGLVELDTGGRDAGGDAGGRVIRFVEKPPADQVFTDLANSGIVICEPGILQKIPAKTQFDIGHDLLPALLADNVPIFGQPIDSSEFVIDIGTPASYQRAQQMAEPAKMNERQ